MDPFEKEKKEYVFTHYAHLMTNQEGRAWIHYTSLIKMEGLTEEQKAARQRLSLKIGYFMTADRDSLKLLDEGIEVFKERVVQRILRENGNEVFLNLCPQCGRLARTPHARQCRCGRD
jgi:hypothetical protein